MSSDELEAAIAEGRPLRIELAESVAQSGQTLEVDPLGIVTEAGSEYLCYRVRGSGLESRVRLDQIKRLGPLLD